MTEYQWKVILTIIKILLPISIYGTANAKHEDEDLLFLIQVIDRENK